MANENKDIFRIQVANADVSATVRNKQWAYVTDRYWITGRETGGTLRNFPSYKGSADGQIMKIDSYQLEDSVMNESGGTVTLTGGLTVSTGDTIIQDGGDFYLESENRHQPTGYGSADIRAHDYADGLLEGDESGVDKTHQHDGGCAGGLDRSGNEKSGYHAGQAVSGHLFQELSHSGAGDLLQAVGHDLHAQEKESQPTNNCNDRIQPIPCVSVVFQAKRAGLPVDAERGKSRSSDPRLGRSVVCCPTRNQGRNGFS